MRFNGYASHVQSYRLPPACKWNIIIIHELDNARVLMRQESCSERAASILRASHMMIDRLTTKSTLQLDKRGLVSCKTRATDKHHGTQRVIHSSNAVFGCK